MVKHKDPTSEETQLTDDLDVFEEFETGERPKKEAQAPLPEEEVEPPEEEVELPEPEEIETTERQAQRVPSAHAPVPETPQTTQARTLADELAELAPDVPVSLVAVVGKTTTTVGDLIRVRMGQVIDLGRAPGETVELVANGRLMARGELVDMDGKLGVRIVKMVR